MIHFCSVLVRMVDFSRKNLYSPSYKQQQVHVHLSLLTVALVSQALSMAGHNIDDITDPTYWCLQQIRIKSAEEKRRLDAEKVKTDRQKALQELKKQFQKLCDENGRREESTRLPKMELILDSKIKETMGT